MNEEIPKLRLTKVFVLLVALPSDHHLATGLLEQLRQAAPVSLGHDAGEVGGALGLLGVEVLQGLSQRRDHGVAGGRRAQHVVGGHAALARVEELGPQQAPHGGRHVHPAEDEARAFAAQLQGDRGEVDGGRLQDDAGHVLRACKGGNGFGGQRSHAAAGVLGASGLAQ